MVRPEAAISVDRSYEPAAGLDRRAAATKHPRSRIPMVLEWRLVGRGRRNPQILARDEQGGVLAINRVLSGGDRTRGG
jgi:hypothetical protein